MDKKEEWGDINLPNEEQKIEIELEDDESNSEERIEEEGVEESKEAQNSDGKGDAPELEGINTKGAEKRIRQLIRQRKERDEHIAALIQKNEELNTPLRTQYKEVDEVNKLSLDASEKQLTDKLELARSVYMEAFEEGEKEKLLKAQEMLNEA